jgi:NAD(P)H-dependent FMN reductase
MKIEMLEKRSDRPLTGKVLAVCGSVRRGSWNGLLLRFMCDLLRIQGVGVQTISLRDYALPFYDGDLEADEGVPAAAVELRDLINEHDGLLIACPEYNGSVTPILKNMIDWCSRPTEGLGALAPFQLKPVLIVGTSVGPFGALRAIGHLRAILSKMGASVIPEDLAVPNAPAALSEDGFSDQNLSIAATRLSAMMVTQLGRMREAKT